MGSIGGLFGPMFYIIFVYTFVYMFIYFLFICIYMFQLYKVSDSGNSPYGSWICFAVRYETLLDVALFPSNDVAVYSGLALIWFEWHLGGLSLA